MIRREESMEEDGVRHGVKGHTQVKEDEDGEDVINDFHQS